MIDLSGQECEYLLEMLRTAHKELLKELNHTDTASYKDKLKNELSINEDLIKKFQLAN